MKQFIKLLIPPILLQLYRKCSKKAWSCTGSYSSFAEARQHSVGYDAPQIIQKVLESTRKVQAGEAVFERDSVLFYHEEYNYNILLPLYRIALEKGRLHVLDFGGALGSTFRQHLKHLKPAIQDFSWNIVEQQSFLEAARQINCENELHFFDSIEKTLESVPIDIILFSGVLQYLENPQEMIEKIKSIPYIIIDIHPEFLTRENPLFTVQNVSEPIYNASYPLKIWGKGELQTMFSEHYEILESWKLKYDYLPKIKDENGIVEKIEYIGMLLKKSQ
jgi:putative methyltransferase (TIGR04325 family)